MKNIHRKKAKFQTILIYIFRLFFCEIPPKEFKPYVFVSPLARERETLKNAASRFELKKRGRLPR
jgi:hypothetical protein